MGEKLGKVIVVTNQKGGVGKTTVARNLGTCLFARGYSVLLIDFDTQGNLSFSCGIKDFKNLPLDQTIAFPFMKALSNEAGAFPVKSVHKSSTARLDVIPANKILKQAENAIIERVPIESNRFIVMKLIINNLKPHYDFIFIDTPPTISLLLQNAIVASDECLLVSSTRGYSVDGIIESFGTINTMAAAAKSDIKIAGVIINDYTKNRGHQDGIIRTLKSICDKRGVHVYDTIIPRAESIEEAMAIGKAAIEYKDISEPALDAFIKVTDEFVKREI